MTLESEDVDSADTLRGWPYDFVGAPLVFGAASMEARRD